jgi:pimeloyl-ACP methyl ester carboxylesterase
MWRAYASLAESENRRAFVRTLRAVIDPGGQSVSARDRLYLAAGVPTLIMWGDEDPIIPVAHAHAAHQAIPGSHLEIFAGAGHFLHVEEPVRFAEALTHFVESTAAAPGEVGSYRELLLARRDGIGSENGVDGNDVGEHASLEVG